MSHITHINDENFQSEVLQETMPVLLDFFADWCGPCKMLSPILEDVASDFEGKAKICKVNVDEARGLASQNNVMSIPTLILYKNGKKQNQIVGVVSKDHIENMINTYL